MDNRGFNHSSNEVSRDFTSSRNNSIGSKSSGAVNSQTVGNAETESRQPQWWPNYKWWPAYHKITKLCALVLISAVTWYTLYIVLGEPVLPYGGRLFQIGLLSAVSMLAARLVSQTNLPGLIGSLLVGALFQNCHVIDLDQSFTEINKFLRGVALIVILVRAGLGLDPDALRRLKFDITKLGFLPWLFESIVVTVLGRYLLHMSWCYGLALGFALSAISPAVTVPSLLRLKSKGYGISKGIPTLVMAVTTLTDVFSVVSFGIVQGFIFSSGNVTNLIIQLPVSVAAGILFGLAWGFICSFCPESNDSSLVFLRVLMILSGGVLSVFGSTALGYGGAGPLGCVIAPYMASLWWTKQGWKVGENPVSESFKMLWSVFEPVLFAITGAQIKVDQLQSHLILIGVAVILVGILCRTSMTVLLGIGSIFSLKEKLFCSMAMATKATVQAALAPVLLGLIPDHNSSDYSDAEVLMVICILSIIVTTPPLAIFMDVFGHHFLKKEASPTDFI